VPRETLPELIYDGIFTMNFRTFAPFSATAFIGVMFGTMCDLALKGNNLNHTNSTA